MLPRVLDCLGCAKVDRRLDFRRATSDPFVDDLDRERRPAGERAQTVADAALAENGRVDAVRECAELIDRGGRIVADLVHLGPYRRFVYAVAEQSELDLDRHQPLLRAVVQVALQPEALVLGRSHDPPP